MKKLLLSLLFIGSFMGILKAQETPPTVLKPVNSQFYINLADSAIWHQKGRAPDGTNYGWERVARYSELITVAGNFKLKNDTVSAQGFARNWQLINLLSFKESVANKATTYGTVNNTLYPSLQLMRDSTLHPNKNLSDLSNIATANTNLGNQKVWNRVGEVVSGTPAQEPTVIVDAGTFKMWYTKGFGGPDTIYYKTSADGITWGAGVSTGVAGNESSVFKNGSTYYMYINKGGVAIARYHSSTGTTSWALDSSSVISLGSAGAWDSINFGNNYVFIDGGGTWHMIYEAKLYNFALGGATSSDGLTWTKTGQILSQYYLGGPFVQKIGSVYYLWCHTTQLPSDIKRFSSSDLLTWAQDPLNPTFVRSTVDEGVGQPYGQVADVSMVEYNGQVYMYYSADPNGITGSNPTIKLAIASMPFTTLITTSEDGAKMDEFAAIYVNGTNVGFGKSAALSPIDVKLFGTNANSGIRLESGGSTNTAGYFGQSEQGSAMLGLLQNNVGEVIHFDAKSGVSNYVNNGGAFYYGTPGVSGNEVAKKSDIPTIAGTANQVTVSGSGPITISLPNSVILSSGSANSQLITNGANSGTNGGGSIVVQNASSTIIDIGNKSNILGGAYDATPTIYATAPIEITQPINVTGTIKATLPTYSSGTYLPTIYNSTNNRFETAAIAPIHGNSTTTGTATTVVTVTIGSTMANTTYNTTITPRDLVTAINYYISAQTTTTFDVTFVTGITGSISFDWNVTP